MNLQISPTMANAKAHTIKKFLCKNQAKPMKKRSKEKKSRKGGAEGFWEGRS